MANSIFPVMAIPFACKDASIVPPTFLSEKAVAIPTSQGGEVLTRHMMNGYGYLASLGYFLDQIGYTYSLPIGSLLSEGYQNAVKRRYDENRRLREYQGSGTEEPPFGEGEDPTGLGNDNWKPTINYKNSFSFPVLDIDSSELAYSGAKDTDNEFAVNVDFPLSPCWVYIKRTILNWDEIATDLQDSYTPTLDVNQLYYTDNEYVRFPEYYNQRLGYSTSIPFMEGAVAGRLFPLGTCGDRKTIRLQISAPEEEAPLVADYGGIAIEVRYFNIPA